MTGNVFINKGTVVGDKLGGTEVDSTTYAKYMSWTDEERANFVGTIDDFPLEMVNSGGGDVPIATTEVAGKVKPDGTTISVANDGTISVIKETKPTVGLIPSMTSNTEPYGTVSSSGATSSSFIDWQAFDGQVGSAYYADHWWSTNNGYIQYTFNKKVSLKRVSLYGYADYTKTNKVELQYSPDGNTYYSIGVFDYTEELNPSIQTMIEFNLIENVRALRLKSVTTVLRIGCIQAYGFVEDSIFDDDSIRIDKGWTSAKIEEELSTMNTNLNNKLDASGGKTFELSTTENEKFRITWESRAVWSGTNILLMTRYNVGILHVDFNGSATIDSVQFTPIWGATPEITTNGIDQVDVKTGRWCEVFGLSSVNKINVNWI